MKTCIVYFDEAGDDGITTASSDHFVLTSVYMPAESWQSNYDKMKNLRKELRDKYEFHVSQEMHTKQFLADKNPYRGYGWTPVIRKNILIDFTKTIAEMDLKIINVIIDKTKIKDENYSVLKSALVYNVQRIENDSKENDWNYLLITDEGRLAPMRKTAREIRAINLVQSKYNYEYKNIPIENMIEDILEKNSSESYFIQIADFVSCFVHYYFEVKVRGKQLPKRI